MILDRSRPIKFHDKELIEDCRTPNKNIPFDTIFGRCAVFKAHENESLTEVLQPHEKNQMAYVCRYKLVKEATIYRLEPVGWQAGDEELRQADELSDFDTDSQSEPIIMDLNATIEQIHSSYTSDKESVDMQQLLVSPISIVNNTVRKAHRNQNNMKSANKRSSPDAALDTQNVSPSKRNKLTDEYDSYMESESPADRTGKYASPARNQMEKVKKNLSNFLEDTSADLDDTPSTPYEPHLHSNNPMKMTLRKKTNEAKTPLKERNDNTETTYDYSNTVGTPITSANRTILKQSYSTRSKCFFAVNIG